MPFELFVAIRYLLARRKQVLISIVSLISVVGVASGVMALIVALALNSGFQREFQERILSATTHVTLLQEQNRSISNYQSIMDRLRRVKKVVSVAPAVYSQALLQGDLGRSQGIYIRGIDPHQPQFMGGLLDQIVEGDITSFGQKSSIPEMIVGEDLAQALGVLVGDQVRALGLRGELAPFGIGRSMRNKRFRITGIFRSGLWEFDANWALIPLRQAQLFEGLSPKEVSALEFRIRDIYEADSISQELSSLAGPTFLPRTWMELNRPLFSALKLEKLALFIAIGLIVLVASLNIIITLTMMVMEKTKDIAVISAIGGLPSTILRIFLLQGVMIGIVGTFIGSTLGSFLVWYLESTQLIALDKTVYSISSVPFELCWGDVIGVSFMAIVVSSLATILPARTASRLKPVEGLRYD